MVTDLDNAPMFYPHITSYFEWEVASPKVEQMFGQEGDCLHLLQISPKHSAHNYALKADYNESSQWLTFHSG